MKCYCLTWIWATGHAGGRQPVVIVLPSRRSPGREQRPSTSKEVSMARTADPQSDSPHTADGQRQPPQERAPKAAAVVLTPKGQRRLAARAAWLATEPIPRFAHYYLDDPDQEGWASAEYGHDVTELA